MKQNRIFILLLLAVALLCGCMQPQITYTVTNNGTVFTVDTENSTISDGQHIYTYEVSGSQVTITYPDGSTYYWTWTGNIGYGGWSEDYDPETYADGGMLIDTLSIEDSKSGSGGGRVLAGLLLIAIGLWYTLSPYSAWYLSYGWRYKDAEPSSAALTVSRISGIVVILFGIVIMFKS